MIRVLLWLLGGVLLGCIVHLATILMLPGLATNDAYARLSAITKLNAVTQQPQPTPEKAVIPFTDPAFAVAVCRYNISQRGLKLNVPVSPSYTSVTFYTPRDIVYYAINDRAAGRRVIELDLLTEKQRGALPQDEEVTAADRLIVVSPTETGLIVIRALAAEPSMMAAVSASLSEASCAPIEDNSARLPPSRALGGRLAQARAATPQ